MIGDQSQWIYDPAIFLLELIPSSVVRPDLLPSSLTRALAYFARTLEAARQGAPGALVGAPASTIARRRFAQR